MFERGRLSLSWILVLGAFSELLLNRIVIRLIDQDLVGFTSTWRLLHGAAHLGGQFALHFTGILALAMCTWGIVGIARDSRLLALPWRIAVTSAGAVLLPLAGMGLFFHLQRRTEFALDLAFVTLAATLLLTVAAHRGAVYHKLGLAYLVGILLLRGSWLLQLHLATALSWPAVSESLATRLYGSSDQLIALGGLVVLLCYAPLVGRRAFLRPFPLLLGLGVTAAATIVVIFEYPLAELIAHRGFNLQLPSSGSFSLALHLLAVFPFTLTVGALLSAGSVATAVGLGLLMIALAGYFLVSPQQILLTLVGLLQLSRAGLSRAASTTATDRRAPSAEQWKTFLGRLASGCCDTEAPCEAVVLQDRRGDIARVRGRLSGLPYAVRLVIRADHVTEVEIDVGQPPKDRAPATLARRRGSRGQRVASGRGPRVKSFDERFVLRDRSGKLAQTLEPHRQQLTDVVHGGLGIWPAEGLRYVCRPTERAWPVPVPEIARSADQADVGPLQQLVTLLVRVALQVDVRG